MKKKVVQRKAAVKKSTGSKKLSSMSFDDLMNTIGDDSSDQNTDTEPNSKDIKQNLAPKKVVQNGRSQVNGNKLLKKHVKDSPDVSDDNSENEASSGVEMSEDEEVESTDENETTADNELSKDDLSAESEDEDESSDEEEDPHAGKKHKQSLSKLKDIDPEFYQYLRENDKKLLQFDVSDSDESDTEQAHDNVPEASSKSDSEAESENDEDSEDRAQGSVVTLKMVKLWREKLATDKTIRTINDVVQAFHAALQRVVPENERDGCPYKVVGGAVFNAVVQMCVLDLLPALQNYLKLPSKPWTHTQLQKNKHWVKAKFLVKSYVVDLLQLLDGVASVNVTTILLKHLHQMCPFVPCFPNISKKLLKKTITLWSTGEETVRVLSFMCALKVTTSQQQTFLDSTLRYMYMAYINNTKFVSPNTLPGIHFMRKSLAEMFLLDENVSYHHAFLYIRQLAIHLRNAISLQKKESIQAVYNWQFMASLALWVELLSSSSKPALRPLLYPVVQIIVGTLKLVPTAQYFPLRFHCVRLLVNLSRDTGTFVPTLPFLLEVLDTYDFNKKHTKVSMKPLDLSCILRVSKIQQQENGFKDAVIESIYNLLLQYAASVSHSIAFPDLMVSAIVQLKAFLKKCKIANYTKKVKQVLEKIEANCRFIEKERKGSDINLTDANAVENWETSIKVKGTPLASFYSSWEKMNSLKESKQQVDRLELSGETSKRKKKGKQKIAEGPTDHLPSDDSDSETSSPKRGKKVQKGSQKKKRKVVENEVSDNEVEEIDDVLEDTSLADW